LNKKQAVRLAVAVSEIITDIVLFAFGPKLGEFELSFISHDDRVELIIHEFGEPFDPERHQYNPERAKTKGFFNGAGFELVRNLVDDFIFLNKGKEGIEFRILQNRSDDHITEIFNASALKVAKKMPTEISYHVKRASSADGEDISKLIYRTYGHSYYKDMMYYPKKIELSLEQKEKFAVICRTQNRIPVGYFAILFSTDSNIGEAGEAVVAVKHRRKGLMKKMLQELVVISREKGLLGLFGEANAAHPFSQRANARFGFKTTALNLAMAPPFDITGVDPTLTSQPVSSVFEYLPLIKEDFVEAYIPAEYNSIITETYQNLGIRLITKEVHEDTFKSKTDFDIQIHYLSKFAIIVVKEFGPYFLDYLQQSMKDLKEQEMNTIYIDLPIHEPETMLLVEDLRRLKFLYGGIMPKYHSEQDYLRMQRTYCLMDMNLIKTYSPLSHRIKGLLVKELE
jgi:anti-sigma regulatory factor (Ser/Thr protein kinase)